MKTGKAIIFSAPSGAGKTTIVRHLVDIPEFSLTFSVSATSRPMRSHEANGRDYYFISSEEFLKRAKNGEFIEWEEVYKDQYYGTLKAEIEKIWAEGKNVIFDVDVIGGLNLKKIFGDKALAIFVRPPSLEALRFRLRNRSTETSEKVAMRIEKAQHEMTFATRFDFILVNDELEKALSEAQKKVQDFLNE
ncbi:MAG: guanylate kinase [Crocinitomicaceae bacterium]|nr:guanylate kinase [Crocinitomicaceae bacterium]